MLAYCGDPRARLEPPLCGAECLQQDAMNSMTPILYRRAPGCEGRASLPQTVR